MVCMNAMDSLRARVARIPDLARSLAGAPPEFPALPGGARVVTTGAGGSAGPARYLAWLLREALDVDARFEPLSRFFTSPPRADALVVFSQYLSPNARLAVSAASSYAWSLLFTSTPAPRGDVPPRVQRVTLAPREESGTLVRVVGPSLALVASAIAASQWGASIGAPPAQLADVYSTTGAPAIPEEALARAATGSLPCAITCGSVDAGVSRALAWKLLEGWSIAEPPTYDALEIAHGPLHAGLSRPHLVVTLETGGAREADLFERLASVLAEGGHTIARVRYDGPRLLAPLAHDAASTALLVAGLDAAPRDVAWISTGRDAPLYRLGE